MQRSGYLTRCLSIWLLKKTEKIEEKKLLILSVVHLFGLPGDGDLVPHVVVERLPRRLHLGVQFSRPLINCQTDSPVFQMYQKIVRAVT